MKLVVRHGAREQKVQLDRDGSRVRMALDGEVMDLEVSHLAGGVRSLIWDGDHFEVTVRHLGDDRYEVSGSFGSETVEVLDPLTHLAATTHDAQLGSGVSRTDAYMPGRVVKVLAAEGETVEAGQGVLVLEAMKMENEIQAESAGVLSRVFVAEGEAVEGGDPLYEIESGAG
ncbi:MAG: biotin/lipoyl-containing protein [Thermoanaerobaculia bacterium]